MEKKHLNEREIKKLFKQFTPQTLDLMFRMLWKPHIKTDIQNRANDLGVHLKASDISYLADRYVFDGEHDANLSHWDNIENLINEYNFYNNQ